MTHPEPVLTPPPPTEKPPRRRDGLVVAVSMVLGALVTLGALLGWQWGIAAGDDAVVATAEEARSSSSTTPATTTTRPDAGPSTTLGSDQQSPEADDPPQDEQAPAVVEPLACPDGVDQVICDAAEFVQRARGRPFRQFPTVELLDDGPFDAALVADLDELRDELRDDERLMKALGLISLDLDLYEAFESLVESGVAGFYDLDDGRLVVRGGELNLYAQTVLVHELVHAIDDQWFDIGRDDFANDDAEYGYIAVIEGNARRVEEQWRAALSPSELATLEQEQFLALSPDDIQTLLSLPQILLDLQLSPYQDGERYVSALAEAGGEQAVDDRLIDPPVSSEQVLDQGSSETSLVVVEVDPPAAGGPVLDEGRLGRLLVGFWLGQPAGRGWGGDGYVVWDDGDRVCVTVDLAADTEADLAEMRATAEAWASGSDLRSVERVDTVDRSLQRVTGCY